MDNLSGEVPCAGGCGVIDRAKAVIEQHAADCSELELEILLDWLRATWFEVGERSQKNTKLAQRMFGQRDCGPC